MKYFPVIVQGVAFGSAFTTTTSNQDHSWSSFSRRRSNSTFRFRISLHPVTNRWAHFLYPEDSYHSPSVPVIQLAEHPIFSSHINHVVFSLFSCRRYLSEVKTERTPFRTKLGNRFGSKLLPEELQLYSQKISRLRNSWLADQHATDFSLSRKDGWNCWK